MSRGVQLLECIVHRVGEGLGQLDSRRVDDPHLHIGSGEYDEAEHVAENPDGNDDEGHHVVGDEVYLLQRLIVRDILIGHYLLTPQLPLELQVKMTHCLFETNRPLGIK